MRTRLTIIALLAVAVLALPGLAWAAELNEQLTASDGANGDEFGAAVDTDSGLTVVGAPSADAGTGAVYVFGSDGTELAILPPPAGAGIRYGATVAVDGDTVLAGAPNADGGGAVYVFETPGDGSWALTATLRASDGAPEAQFGASVDADAGRVLVGAPFSGAAYLYAPLGDGWSETKLTPFDGATGTQFGISVGLHDDRAVVGAWLTTVDIVVDDSGALVCCAGAGAVYVYDESSSGIWTSGRIENPKPLNFSGFGRAVAAFEGGVAVGAYNHELSDMTRPGTAWVFSPIGPSTWDATELPPPSGVNGDWYGRSIDASDTQVIVGAPQDDEPLNQTGAAFVWTQGAAGWSVASVTPAGLSESDFLGTEVAVSGGLVAAGAPNMGGTSAGAVYIDLNDSDLDADGISDGLDNCPNLANPDQADLDADGVGDVCDDDVDGDGALDDVDNCETTPNADQADLDGDGLGDVCDDDRDGDGIANAADNCADVANPDQVDLDGDGLGDACDSDDDADSVADDVDNCETTPNADQADLDGDGLGDVCDDDRDGDGVANAADNCADVANPDQADANGNGVGDACDAVGDVDEDGVADDVDNCVDDANADQADADADGLGDVCDDDRDGDGVANAADNCADDANADQADADADGLGDVCDDDPYPVTDSDGDGIPDAEDEFPFDGDNDSVDDATDICPGTVIPELTIPTTRLGKGRYAMVDNDLVFDTPDQGRSSRRPEITIVHTFGCNATQIVEALGLGDGHTRFGLSFGAVRRWILTNGGDMTMLRPKR